MRGAGELGEPLRVLLAEDNEGDVRLIERALRQAAPECRFDAVENGDRALAFLRGEPPYSGATRPDLVLLDLKLPRVSGLEVLAELKRDARLRRIPVVMLSSSRADHDIARAYELHATAYIAKPVSDYREVIESVVRFVKAVERPHARGPELRWDDTESFVPQPASDEGEPAPTRSSLQSAIIESSPDAIMSTDRSGILTSWNAAAERLFDVTARLALGKHVRAVLPDERLHALEATLLAVQRDPQPTTIETQRVDRAGRRRPVSLSVSPLTDAQGRSIGSVATARDITERKRTAETIRLTVEAAPTAMIMTDEAGTITLVNQRVERLFGYQRSELVGRSIDMLVPTRYRALHKQHRKAFAERPETRPMAPGRELYGLRRDGVELPIEIGLTPIVTQDGLAILSSIVDVSERRQAEERFRLAVEASPNGMLMVNEQGEMLLVNAETEHMFGYARDELVGRPVEMLVPERFRARHPDHRASFGETPQRRLLAGRDLVGLRKGGSEFPVEIGLNPINTPQGLLVLCSVVDITERKQAQEALEARSSQLLRSNAELEQFAYVASHDLQEPLRMVASYTSLLAEEYGGKLDADAKLYIHFAKEGAERMQQLIHDLLAYSRVASRKRPPSLVSADQCLDLALANLRISLDETAGVVHRPVELPTLLGDRSQLVELFQNLIANAIKFRRELPPFIDVTAEAMPEGMRFAVRDNGIGIERQYYDDVFQVFRRLHTRDEYPGTGIGLAICKRIVERVGGRIWVESRIGEGSTFFFVWPNALPEGPAQHQTLPEGPAQHQTDSH